MTIQTAIRELRDVLTLCDVARVSEEADVTPVSQKTYRVANVIRTPKGFQVSRLRSRGTFLCAECPSFDESNPKVFNEDNWCQITRGSASILLHSKDIHNLNFHIDQVSQQIFKDVLAVFG